MCYSGRRFPRVHLPPPALDTFGEPELLDLDDRSAHILRMRSGMVDGEHHTFREIADELGVTPERARQIQNQSLDLIRQLREVQRHLRYEPRVRT
jgi:DNA-directed RNA polymerase sigma subunit (sigma70/sigma32)